MSQRKLALLGYPADYFDWDNADQFYELVLDLEDQHIRHYRIEDREDLRSVDKDVWDKAFAKYLKDLHCPLSPETDSQKEIIDWLLNYAIDIVYEETEQAKNLTVANLKKMKKTIEKQRKADDPLSALDLNSAEFKNGIEQLRSLLGLAAHPDPLIVLKAACKYIVKNLSDEAIEEANKSAAANAQKKVMQLSRFDLGMASSKNATVDAAVRVLRLIHLDNLREVQTEINEVIVAVQEITADPKTDKRLGKVGF